ncbi:MAG: AbrB/MazE/SpoVT family DNA-binding domain-containing protein [bacterium]
MPTATVTSKGQVTIPVSIRQELDLEAGDSLVFASELDGHSFRAAKRHSITSLRGILADAKGPTIKDWTKVRRQFEKAAAADALKYLNQ